MSDSARRQLLVEVGGCLFAAAADEVREVMDPTEATPVPGAIQGVLGLLNRRGKVIVAGELGTFLGVESEPGVESALVVFADGDRRVALMVDRVIGMASYSATELDVESDLLEALGARDLAVGVGHFGPRPYIRLDVPAIFARVFDQAGDRERSIRLGSTVR
ncbi:MAG: chemotaxis protein CheW [Gemmatimonadota bacterium]|nr:MAG: chemotaxis protein CheW [Gemmatimonadota bacterium]